MPFGRTTAQIGLAVSGSAEHLEAEREAMIAHASQIAPDEVPAAAFAAAYGFEWYRRSGNPGLLDALGNVHLLAPVPA